MHAAHDHGLHACRVRQPRDAPGRFDGQRLAGDADQVVRPQALQLGVQALQVFIPDLDRNLRRHERGEPHEGVGRAGSTAQEEPFPAGVYQDNTVDVQLSQPPTLAVLQIIAWNRRRSEMRGLWMDVYNRRRWCGSEVVTPTRISLGQGSEHAQRLRKMRTAEAIRMKPSASFRAITGTIPTNRPPSRAPITEPSPMGSAMPSRSFRSRSIPCRA